MFTDYVLVGVGSVSLLACAVLVPALSAWINGRRGPPGPPTRFLVGNLYDLPTKDVHLEYARMAEKYGPVIMLRLPMAKIVVLSTAKAASDLLDKQGSVFADRPALPMLELMGWGWNTAFERYSDSWRVHRKILQRCLSGVALKQYAAVQTRAAHVFALGLLEAPTRFVHHLRRATAASILETAYGFEIAREDDPFVKISEDAVQSLVSALVPGKYAVDVIPALKYIPTWFPGAQFKRDALKWREYPEKMLNAPFARAKEDMERGIAQPSVLSAALDERSTPEWERIVTETVGVMYNGGSDTTLSTLLTFFLEMVRHPDVLARAQREIDSVVGNHRLPTLDDRESLPYIEALIRELLRIHPVVPMGFPHRALKDSCYEGMLIPEGTIVFANAWKILHNAEVYTDPHIFNPERFLREEKIDDSMPDPRSAVFGFGRRICPGMHFADTTLYLTIATTLACFNLTKAVKNGLEVEPSGEFSDGVISSPVPFECTITPRSDEIAVLIDQALDVEKFC